MRTAGFGDTQWLDGKSEYLQTGFSLKSMPLEWWATSHGILLMSARHSRHGCAYLVGSASYGGVVFLVSRLVRLP